MASILSKLEAATCGSDLRPEDQANAGRFSLWCLASALSYVLGIFVLEMDYLPPGAPRVIFALLCIVPAFGAVRSYRYFLRQADEMTRLIHLESLAYGFGAGVIFSLGWRLLERAGAPTLDISDSVVVSMVAWSAGQILSTRKYR